jgi:Asp-tRNA(Asn)/Glu-tRNA(Gln) amidotransferase A subunit family amidase
MRAKTTSRRTFLKSTVYAAPLAAPIIIGAVSLLAGCARTAGDEALKLGAREAVSRIAKGEMKAEAYAATLLKHYAAHKNLNAVVTMDEQRVMETARGIDKLRSDGAKLGALAGLPVAVKDQIDVAGYPTSAGNGALKPFYRPAQSAQVVEAMQNAGAVVFCKTLCPDMVGSGGLSPASATTDNRWFGSAHNPYDLLRTPGGSSGGNGALLAAGVVPAAIGEDTGGSIRLPAAFCGIAGLRPSVFTVENLTKDTTRKRYADAGIVPPPGLLETFGPMARTVADVAFLDAAITGEATPPMPDLKSVRIGIPQADYYDIAAMDPAVAKLTQGVFAKLKAAGVTLVEFDLKMIQSLNEGGRLSAGPPRQSLSDWLEDNTPGLNMDGIMARRIVPARGPAGMIPPPPDMSADERLQIFEASFRVYEDLFKRNGITAIAFPTVGFTAPFINLNGDTPNQTILVGKERVDEIIALIANVFSGPRFGAPGLSLPSGLVNGLPVGLCLEGMPGDDPKILALGMAVEKVLGPIPGPQFPVSLATNLKDA